MSPLEQLIGNWPLASWNDCHVVVAVSGGADSVALLRLLHEIKSAEAGLGRLQVAHFNHQLRGAEAAGDAHFVSTLAASLGLECHVGRATAQARCPLDALPRDEDRLRRMRYDFLSGVAGHTGARYVAVAHTADDQVETVLHRLLRGTGLKGLGGMPANRPLNPSVTLMRPLLTVRRHELRDYLEGLDQGFREDTSNGQSHYLRSRLRHEVLPELRRVAGAQVDDSILRVGHQAQQTAAWLQQYAARLVAETGDLAIVSDGGSLELSLDTRSLADQPEIVRREIVRFVWSQAGLPERGMSLEDWNLLAALLRADNSGRITLPGGVRATRAGVRLQLVRC